ncbi:hypothetical protein Y032_0053g2360 [Ancylostoma ceylanicum]|uniref:Uncharacterized protein n=1 Tax=Ancylostoma ceylanicum TaxID=53326 RepID=A0A016U8F9_9BILA|nr:hypothetical protein Y032_0053g2360 [Ancylostoma ceylanicum]
MTSKNMGGRVGRNNGSDGSELHPGNIVFAQQGFRGNFGENNHFLDHIRSQTEDCSCKEKTVQRSCGTQEYQLLT